MKNTKLSKKEFDHIVKLSNMFPANHEKEKIRGMLGEALEAVEVFKELDTANVPTLDHPTDLKNVLREDEVVASLSQEEALSGAVRKHDGYFVVDAVFDNSDE